MFRKQKPNIIRSRREWQRWQVSALGEALMVQEQKILGNLLERVAGRELLQISIAGGLPLYERSPIANKTLVHFEYPVSGLGNAVVSLPEYLPICNESIDVLILHHVLEFSGNRHQILREAHRALASGGQLFVVGFNPWSLWSLRRALTYSRRVPWAGHYLSRHRLCDWLSLLGFTLQEVQFAQFGWPCSNSRNNDNDSKKDTWIENMGEKYNCFLGGFYALSARKQVIGMTPVSQKGFRKRILSFPVTEPSIRSLQSDD